MTWQQFLTEKVLKECDHKYARTGALWGTGVCVKCKAKLPTERRFNNRNDMMDLYEAIERDGKWEEFYDYFFDFELEKDMRVFPSAFTAILFCLSGEGYEDRCKMVAEFYGWEEK